MKRLLFLIPLAALAFPAFAQTVAAPVFAPPTGTQFANGQIVTLTSATSGATLIYTLDGSTPTANSSCTATHGTSLSNGGTVNISATETVKVIGCHSGDTTSSAVSASFTVGGGVTSNIDDIPPTSSSSPSIGWATPPYIDSGCGDPTGPTSYPHTVGNVTPSLDGFSSFFQIVSAPEGCVGWFYNAGPQDHATTLINDFQYESGSTNATGNANEFDVYQYVKSASNPSCLPHDTDLYFGTQCVVSSGHLEIWDQGGTGWHPTSPTIDCAPGFAAGTGWHHITMNDHWTCGDTSGTGGYPKQCYDSFVLDGTTFPINTCYSASALPGGYGENTGANIELDVGSAGTTLSANVDEESLTFLNGGVCPTGANYLQESTNTFVTLSTLGVTSCVYVAASGSDSNTGTSASSPWLHAPGMTACSSNCAAFAMAPGIGILLRGGDTWHLGNSSLSPYVGAAQWTQSVAGNSTNPVYIGSDPAWYSGGSWTQPALNGDNALWDGVSNLPSSCPTHDFSTSAGLTLAAYNILENIQVLGVCSGYTGTSANPMFLQAGNNDTIEYYYYHGWTVTQASTNLYGAATGINNGGNVIFTHYAIDGTDSPHYSASSAECTFQTLWPCATGQGFYDHAYKLEYGVCRYTANCGVLTDTVSIHDNLIEYLQTAVTTAMNNAQHADGYMVYSGTLQYLYNNVARHNTATQLMYANVNSGGALHLFNNTFYDNLKYGPSGGDAAPTNCINLAAQTNGAAQTLYVYNNTFDFDTDDSTGGGCQIQLYGTSGGNSEGFDWGGTIYAANNHLIGYSNLASLFHARDGTATFTLTDNGGETVQATATARSQGYVQSTSPVGDLSVNGSGSTIAAGVNETSSCSTFSSDSALCSGTGGGPIESGGVFSFPAIPINPRPSSGAWDSEALQYAGGGPAYPLTVSISGVGSGTITSSPSGISCPGTCTASFTTGANVTLSSSTTGGNYLGQWTGACNAGSPLPATTPCIVTMSAAESVTAVFGNSNNAPASYPIQNANNTSTAAVQPNSLNLGGTLGQGNSGLNAFGENVTRLTDAAWDAGPGNTTGPPGYTITSLSESGTTVTMVLSTTPSPAATCGSGLTNCWTITAPSPYAGYNALTAISGSGTTYTYTATTSGLATCSSNCGLAAQVQTSSDSYWPFANSDWNDVSCGDNFLAFSNNGGEAHVMGLYQSGGQVSPIHLYPTNASYIQYGGLRFTGNGDFSRNCVATPNLYYYLSGSSLMSYDFSSALPLSSTGPSNPSSSPTSATVFNFVAGSTGSWGTTSSNGLPASCTSPNWTDYAIASKNPPDAIIGGNFGCQQTTSAGGITIDVAVGSKVFTIDSGSALTSLHTDGTNDMAPIDTGGTTNAFQFAIQCVTGETSPINCSGGGGSAGTGGLLTQNWSLPGSSDCTNPSSDGIHYVCPSVMHGSQDNAFLTCLRLTINVLTGAVIAPSVACMNWGTGYVTADAATGILSGATTLVPGGGYTTNGIYLHGSRVTLGANYIDGSVAQPVPGAPASATNNIGLMWNLAAASLAEEIVPGCAQFPPGCNGTGHKTDGFAYMYNPSTGNFPQMVQRAYGTNMASYTAGPGGGCTPSTCYYVTNSTGPFTTGSDFDWHTAAVNADTADTAPFIYASVSYLLDATPPGSYTFAGENEMDFVTPSFTQSGAWYRAGHTMACGTNSIIQKLNSMEISGDGLMVPFTSDWCSAASPTVGTVGCPDLSNDCTSGGQRGDLYLMAMSTAFPVTVSASGSGSVTSSPSGISCPSTCSASLSGTVTLTQAPSGQSVYAAWGGACASFGNLPTCTLTVTASVSVSIAFAAPPHTINAINAPKTPGDANYTPFNNLLASSPPYLTAQTPFASGGTVAGLNPLAIDSETTAGVACSPTFTNWANFTSVVNSYKTNWIIQPASEGNASDATSACVWSQAQANASALTYTTGTVALAGYYFNVSGKYWQIMTPCYTSGFSAGCTLGTATFPGSPTLGQTYTDSNGVVTTYRGTQAPLQDGVCGSGHECIVASVACSTTTAGVVINAGNLGSCTLAQLYEAQPIPYELPFINWNEKILTAFINYAAANWPTLGYVRPGNPMGGELGGKFLASSSTPTWPYAGSSLASLRAQYLSNIAILDAFIASINPAWVSQHLLSDFNSAGVDGTADVQYADQEALLASQNNFWGIGQQNFTILDQINVLASETNPYSPCGNPPTLGTGCTQGDWLPIFYAYPAMHHELQPQLGSTPAYCNSGSVGPLAPIGVIAGQCTAGSIGLIPFLIGLNTTGYNGALINADTFESPTNASGTYPTADASDTLLALCSNIACTYASTVGAISQYVAYEAIYNLMYCEFLGGVCTVIVPPTFGTAILMSENEPQRP